MCCPQQSFVNVYSPKSFRLSICLISLPSMVISKFDASFWVLCLDPSVMHEFYRNVSVFCDVLPKT